MSANIFGRRFRDLLVRTRKVKQHTYLMLYKCLFLLTMLFARALSLVTRLSNRISSSIDSSFVTLVGTCDNYIGDNYKMTAVCSSGK